MLFPCLLSVASFFLLWIRSKRSSCGVLGTRQVGSEAAGNENQWPAAPLQNRHVFRTFQVIALDSRRYWYLITTWNECIDCLLSKKPLSPLSFSLSLDFFDQCLGPIQVPERDGIRVRLHPWPNRSHLQTTQGLGLGSCHHLTPIPRG